MELSHFKEVEYYGIIQYCRLYLRGLHLPITLRKSFTIFYLQLEQESH